MDLLNKLEKVEIQTTDRFPAEDTELCRNEEKIYHETFNIYSELVYIIEDAVERLRNIVESTYVQSIDDNKDKLYNCSERFINKICGHFKKKYAVSLDSPSWMAEEEKYGRRQKTERHDIVPLQYILDSIYDQMGGMSFEEKAFSELKEDVRQAVIGRNDLSKYRLQNTKLIIDEFYWSYKHSVWERYKATVDVKHRAFFKALTHFEYSYYGISQKYGFLCGYDIDEEEGAYDKHLLSSVVINSIKVFKNGKIEVEFKDYRKAVKFMDTYFPGIPQKAAA